MSDKIERIIDALRKKILESAIRGELVPQNPEDEPASKLLERIAEERERLIKEKKIKKPKSVSRIFRRDGHFYESINEGKPTCIDDDIPFDIPDSWEWVRIGEAFFLQAGKNISSGKIQNDYFVDSFPCYGGNGIRGYVDIYNRDGVYPIIGRQGALCGNVNLASGKFYATEHAVCVETYGDFNKEWVYSTLKALNLNQYATATAQPGLAVGVINAVLIPIPPIQEQQRIVNILDTENEKLDTLLQSRLRYNRILSETPTSLRQQLIQAAIQGQLVPQNPNDEPARKLLSRIAQERTAKLGKKAAKSMSRIERRGSKTYIEITPDGKEKDISEEIPFDIPQNWEWCRLEQIGDAYIGLTYSPSDVREKGTAVLRANNIQNGKISYDEVLHVETDIPERAYINKGDLLICARNGSKNLVGKTAIVERNGDAYGAFMAKFVSISSQYLYYFFSSQFFREQLDDANTTTIYQVTQSMLKRLLCPVPPAAEQVRICYRLGFLLKTLDN